MKSGKGCQQKLECTNNNCRELQYSVQVQPKEFWPLEALVESTNEVAEENIEQYVEHSRVSTSIGGRKAIIQTYEGYDSEHVLSSFTTSYIVGDKFIWAVVCVCDSENFDTYKDTFDNIVRSLRVEY